MTMKATLNGDEEIQFSHNEGPGHRLRRLREEAELELSRVAVLLHLSEEKLIALEADDYASLPGPVFIQGYLRNYARLLRVPVESVLDAYHAASPESKRIPELKITQISHEVGSSHALVRLVTWGLVIGIILLLVVWWRGHLQWPMQISGSADEENTSQAVSEENEIQETDAEQKFPVVEVGENGVVTLSVPPPVREADTTVAPTDAASVQALAGVTASDAGAVADSGSADSAPVSAVASAVPAAPAAVVPGQVVLEFGGTSWTKVVDGNGTVLTERSMSAGTRFQLEGNPPYRLTIGNATAVKILIGGRDYDFSHNIRGNVARFTLDPGTSFE